MTFLRTNSVRLLFGFSCFAVIMIGAPASSRPNAAASYSKLPLAFEANLGQTDPRVRFLSRAAGSTILLTGADAVIATAGEIPVRIHLTGASPAPLITGIDARLARTNYIRGSHSQRTHAGVTTYGRAVDPAGNVYVTGFTNSADWPATANADRPSKSGNYDAYVAKIAP